MSTGVTEAPVRFQVPARTRDLSRERVDQIERALRGCHSGLTVGQISARTSLSAELVTQLLGANTTRFRRAGPGRWVIAPAGRDESCSGK
jgi:hypothetical protein